MSAKPDGRCEPGERIYAERRPNNKPISTPVTPTIAAAASGCCRAKSHASLVIRLRVSLIEHDGDPGFGAVASEAAVGPGAEPSLL